MIRPIFLVARSGSTRLPAKILAEIQGKTLLEHLIQRMKSSRQANQVVVCTTLLEPDRRLVEIAAACGASAYQGDPDDVPNRLLGAARQFEADFFVLVEGDEVFTDPEFVDRIFLQYDRSGADFIKTGGLPIGSWTAGLKTAALEKVCQMKAPGEVDGWGRFLTDSGIFQVETIFPEPSLPAFDPQLRLTLDYPEDLKLVKEIFARLSPNGEPFSLRQALSLLQQEPELVEINKHLNQVYWQRYQTPPEPAKK